MKVTRKNKGFTLMEMLIVVAIIGVLVAMSVSILSGVIERAREAADLANIRNTYAEIMIKVLEDENIQPTSVKLTQKQDGWNKITDAEDTLSRLGTVEGTPEANGTCEISWDSSTGTITFKFGEEASLFVVFPDEPNARSKRKDFAEAYVKVVQQLLNSETIQSTLNGKNKSSLIYTYSKEGHEDKEITMFYSKGPLGINLPQAMKDFGYSQEDQDIVKNYGPRIYVYFDGNELLGYSFVEAVGSSKDQYRLIDKNGVQVYESTSSDLSSGDRDLIMEKLLKY